MSEASDKGLEWWRPRLEGGRERLYKTPEDMREAVMAYMEMVANTHIEKPDVVKGGDSAGVQIATNIPMYPSVIGLSNYLGFKSKQTYYNYRERTGFLDVLKEADDIMTAWQLQGAVVGYYNQSIVARLLGLADKQEVDVKVKSYRVGFEKPDDD